MSRAIARLRHYPETGVCDWLPVVVVVVADEGEFSGAT